MNLIPFIALLLFWQENPHIDPETPARYPMFHLACKNGDSAPLIDVRGKVLGSVYCDGEHLVFAPANIWVAPNGSLQKKK